MIRLVPHEFVKQIIDICANSEIVENLNTEIYEDVIVRCRVFLIDKSFADIYYNFETGKTAFALIKDNDRIFGADNTGKWHIHPFENLKKHLVSEEVDFVWFLKRIENRLMKDENSCRDGDIKL